MKNFVKSVGAVATVAAAGVASADVAVTYSFDPANPGDSANGLATAAAPGISTGLGTWLTVLPVLIFLAVGGFILGRMKSMSLMGSK